MSILKIKDGNNQWINIPTIKGNKGDTGATGPQGPKGDKGDSGQDGQNGTDGFSPVASVSKSGNVATITITDKNGTTTAQISESVDSVNGKTGAVVLDAEDVGALPDDTAIPSKTSDLTNDSGFITGMTILSYGSSTWNDFLTAYNANKVVYCRASSNSDPATGSQTRLAFMAYVDNATTPTNVEFQYYRSVSSHTASQQGDQVYVYKLTSAGTWTVTVREAMSKIAAGTNMSLNYSNETITLNSSPAVVNVSGATPTITAQAETRYLCGEVTTLSFTPCVSGICDVRFTSGSTVTVLTIPNTVKFPDWFDPSSLETNTIYEINILDGVYGVVTTWAV